MTFASRFMTGTEACFSSGKSSRHTLIYHRRNNSGTHDVTAAMLCDIGLRFKNEFIDYLDAIQPLPCYVCMYVCMYA